MNSVTGSLRAEVFKLRHFKTGGLHLAARFEDLQFTGREKNELKKKKALTTCPFIALALAKPRPPARVTADPPTSVRHARVLSSNQTRTRGGG